MDWINADHAALQVRVERKATSGPVSRMVDKLPH